MINVVTGNKGTIVLDYNNLKNIVVKNKVKLEFIDKDHSLYSINGKNKGITYYTDTLGNISVIGGAAGTKNAA